MLWRALLCAAVCAVAAAVPAPQPLDLHETVRAYLDNGGHERLREHLDLEDGVVYNPLLHLHVDDAPARLGGESLSELELLRRVGLHVPGVDDESALRSGEALKLVTSSRQFTQEVGNENTKSRYSVTFIGRPPEQARQAFLHALGIWANTFPCRVKLRVLFKWDSLAGSRTLAAAVSPFSIVGGSSLQRDAAYTPTMAAAVTGVDRIPGKAHIQLVFNGAQDWHYITNRDAPFRKYDFVTVALHELCHGLFFTGALLGKPESGVAVYQSLNELPARFDQFIQMSNGIGIARSCEGRELLSALTRRGLSFRTANVESTFKLFAPTDYRPGSSTYHLATAGLAESCRQFNIPKVQCSDLMTFELDPGYTQHVIGEPTLRIMRSVLGKSPGLVGSNQCQIPAALAAPEENSKLGVLDKEADIGPFKVKLWVIIVAGCVAAVGVGLVLFFIATAFARR